MKKFIIWLILVIIFALAGLLIIAYLENQKPPTPPTPQPPTGEKQLGKILFGVGDIAYPIASIKYSTGSNQKLTNALTNARGEF